jgi:hypothetical protein
MSLFKSVFDKSSIYDLLFINVKSVLESPTLETLREYKPEMFDRWRYISKHKFNVDFDTSDEIIIRKTYDENAVKFPEYLQIVAITYAKVFSENGTLKRDFKKISQPNEIDNVQIFMDVLHQISSDGLKSTPQYFPIICGHNIIAHDIPLLIKKHIQYRDELVNKQIPLILKLGLDAKPWESTVIDVINVWKFNGYDYNTLMMIADFMGLKKTQNLLSREELSQYYWNNIGERPEETIEYIVKQSANQTNLVIQFMNEMRQF